MISICVYGVGMLASLFFTGSDTFYQDEEEFNGAAQIQDEESIE